jgi:hypothetical protein
LKNLELVAVEISPPIQLVVRTPLIRDRTATKLEIEVTGAWIAKKLGPRLPAWELFEPKAVCEDTIPLSADELRQVQSWAHRVYPPEKVTAINQLGQIHDTSIL